MEAAWFEGAQSIRTKPTVSVDEITVDTRKTARYRPPSLVAVVEEETMPRVDITRRTLLRRAAGLGALALAPGALGACGDDEETAGGGTSEASSDWPPIKSKEVVVAGFGGITYQVRRQILFEEFTELSGAKVVEAPWDYGKFVAMLDSSNPEWDMLDFDGFSMIGLLDAGAKLAKLEPWVERCDLVDKEYRDYAAGSYAYSVVLGWTDEAGDAGSWADFFDTAGFPGKRAFPKSIYAGTLELALLADGVAREQIYPRSEEHTSELQSPCNLVCRLLLEKKKDSATQKLCLIYIQARAKIVCLTTKIAFKQK